MVKEEEAEKCLLWLAACVTEKEKERGGKRSGNIRTTNS